ncbi:MAG: 4a-hydroxytetrahydrobiopterin dehydratase [Pyrinomonadaceae bacterium]
MKAEQLNEAEILEQTKKLNQWRVKDKFLHKRFEFNNFKDSLAFVNSVGGCAEAADHHPDITFGWGYAEIVLTTHDAGGLTEKDFSLAEKIDGLG